MERSAQTERRDVALNRAVDLFWKQGYHATSMRAVEQKLGMHPGSIYAAFESKENLFRLALARYAERIAADRDAAIAAAPTRLKGLANFVRDAHPVVRSDLPLPACMLAKSAMEGGFPPGATQDQIASQLASTEAAFTEIFEQAAAAGELRPGADPASLARWLHVKLAGLGLYAQRPDRTTVTRAMAEELAVEIEALGKPGSD